MEQILNTVEFSAWATRLARPFEFLSPFGDRDFALLLFVEDGSVTTDEQARISEAIVRQGCRYAVCAGVECSSWDTSIDMAYIATDPDFSPSDSSFVMTTWHDDESIDDVAEFLAFSATYEGFGDPPPRRYLVVCIGEGAAYVDVRDAVSKQLRLRSA